MLQDREPRCPRIDSRLAVLHVLAIGLHRGRLRGRAGCAVASVGATNNGNENERGETGEDEGFHTPTLGKGRAMLCGVGWERSVGTSCDRFSPSIRRENLVERRKPNAHPCKAQSGIGSFMGKKKPLRFCAEAFVFYQMKEIISSWTSCNGTSRTTRCRPLQPKARPCPT